jgi:single stranded DNA-binding protein
MEALIMSVNKAIVVGNLGRDPEVRALPSGQSVASFSIATTARFKDRDGEPQQRTEWHRVVAFGRLADNCQRLLAKGRMASIHRRPDLQACQPPTTCSAALRVIEIPNRRKYRQRSSAAVE